MWVGIDLVRVSRLAHIMQNCPSLAKRVFSIGELALAEGMGEARRREFFAGRFAVKEAALKALSTGLAGDVVVTDIEALRTSQGAPLLKLSGTAQERSIALGVKECQVSISHEGDVAIAVVTML